VAGTARGVAALLEVVVLDVPPELVLVPLVEPAAVAAVVAGALDPPPQAASSAVTEAPAPTRAVRASSMRRENRLPMRPDDRSLGLSLD
jgi:hypothetical protein